MDASATHAELLASRLEQKNQIAREGEPYMPASAKLDDNVVRAHRIDNSRNLQK